MCPGPPLMTVDEYFRTPEMVVPSELVFGVMRVAESPSPRHQSAVADLFMALAHHVRERGLGRMWLSPLDVVLDAPRALVLQPDLMFVSNAREFIVQDRMRGAPDLVIEVLSPHPRIGKTAERVEWFAEYGVRECWLVHQDQRDVTVITCENRRAVRRQTHLFRSPIQSSVLPDFSLTLADILEQS